MSAETAHTPRIDLPGAEYIFGTTTGMRGIRKDVERALHDDLPVLIEGESGTGKEVIGRFLHRESKRRLGPFIKVNCGAVSASVLDGEMFGSEVGAAGHALEGKSGSIEMASGGVLFLDEIGALDRALLQKLMRIFELGYYRRIGGKEDLLARARLVCATSSDSEADGRKFPASLLDSFVHRVRLLPLRERKEDIPQLCEYLLEKFARAFGRPVPHLSGYVLEAFQLWKWPGNIRELENWIARIVIFGTEEAIGLEFNRQLEAFVTPAPRQHRATRTMVGRSRRVRRRI